MSPLLAIGLFFGVSVIASALFILGAQLGYTRGWGDGYNHCADRFMRPSVPLSEEVLMERERRGR